MISRNARRSLCTGRCMVTCKKFSPGLIYLKIPGTVQHRTLEVKRAERLGINDIKPGDELLAVLDEDNLIIDVHRRASLPIIALWKEH
jgi:hypothetical protein